MSNKWLRRIRIILSYSTGNLLLPVSNVIISLAVVRLCSGRLWGEIVNVNLWITLAGMVMSWGNRDFLLKEFSKSPGKVEVLWKESFSNRLWLLLIIDGLVFLFPFSFYLKILLIAWLSARFIYQSFDSLVAYERHYGFLGAAEITGLLLTVVPVFILRASIDFPGLVMLFSISAIVKCCIGMIRYRKLVFRLPGISFDAKYFSRTFLFLMMALSGLVYARTDQYCVAIMLSKNELATYSVFRNFLGFAQFASTFILSPFTKNIFRLNSRALHKLQRFMVFSGILFSFACVAGTFLFIHFFYRFNLPWKMYVLGFIFVYAFYIFQLRIYRFIKEERQKGIIAVTCLAAVIIA